MYSKPKTGNRIAYDEHWRKWREKFGAKRNLRQTIQATPAIPDEVDDLTDDELEDIDTSA